MGEQSQGPALIWHLHHTGAPWVFRKVYWVNKPVREQKRTCWDGRALGQPPSGSGLPSDPPASDWSQDPLRATSRTTQRFLRVQKERCQLHGALGSELSAQHSCSADVDEWSPDTLWGVPPCPASLLRCIPQLASLPHLFLHPSTAFSRTHMNPLHP